MERVDQEVYRTSKQHKNSLQSVHSAPPGEVRLMRLCPWKSYLSWESVRKNKPLRSAIERRHRWLCVYCGVHKSVKKLTLDHVIPRSAGGDNSLTNLVSACQACNSSKNDKVLESWASSSQVERLRREIAIPLTTQEV